MIFKILGIILILLSTSLLGYYLSQKDKYRAEDLEEFKKAIIILKGSIDYSALPLAEALLEASKRIRGPAADIFEEAAQRLCKRSGNAASEIWEEVLIQKGPKTCLASEDMEAIAAFGRTLGYLDRGQQVNQAELTIHYLNSTQERILEKNAKEGKVFRSMGVLSGLLICVILF